MVEPTPPELREPLVLHLILRQRPLGNEEEREVFLNDLVEALRQKIKGKALCQVTLKSYTEYLAQQARGGKRRKTAQSMQNWNRMKKDFQEKFEGREKDTCFCATQPQICFDQRRFLSLAFPCSSLEEELNKRLEGTSNLSEKIQVLPRQGAGFSLG